MSGDYPKIIKRGIVPADKIYRDTCSNCKTVFEFKKENTRPSADPRDRNLMVVDCPVCDKECYKQM